LIVFFLILLLSPSNQSKRKIIRGNVIATSLEHNARRYENRDKGYKQFMILDFGFWISDLINNKMAPRKKVVVRRSSR
jgi:hypothetical protein